MLSPEDGLIFLAIAGFLLLIFLMTQVTFGRAPADDLLAPDSSEATEKMIRNLTLPDEQKPGPLERVDRGFAEMIERADLQMAPDQALGVMFLTGVVVATAGYLWKGELWTTALGFFLGMGGILLYYLVRQSGYSRRLQLQLPDAIFLLARSLRAGMSMEQAIDQAATQGAKPLSSEFQRASRQISLGLSIPAALQSIANRVRLVDMDTLVSTVSLHSQTGGNLALLLDRLANSVRDHNQFRSYFRSATAQGRITALFIGAAAPLLLLAYSILDPEHLQTFMRSNSGKAIIAGCLALELIGAYWLYRVLRIDYY